MVVEGGEFFEYLVGGLDDVVVDLVFDFIGIDYLFVVMGDLDFGDVYCVVFWVYFDVDDLGGLGGVEIGKFVVEVVCIGEVMFFQ